MATVIEQQRPETIAPAPAQNQVDALGARSAQDIARRVWGRHLAMLRARRQRDLISEKLLLHIDGSGDAQWADIRYGAQVEIPRAVSEFRKTENMLRGIVDNAVAQHTTMPLRYHAESTPDRQARNKAILDTLWINYLAQAQDFNALFADAMYLAMPAGFCTVHGYWREDVLYDWWDPTAPAQALESILPFFVPRPGMLDCWTGNPFDTCFNPGATRGSIRSASYGRLLPADQVRQAFARVAGVSGLQGTKRLSSASEFQRIARTWIAGGLTDSLGAHGSPVITGYGPSEHSEELLTVVCEEIAPTGDGEFPDGRLRIIAVPGETDSRAGRGEGKHALLLADQPLPGGDYSFSVFYSHHRGSDVYGKPWVEEIDPLQVDLNITVSKEWEQILKMAEAPIVAPGGAIGEDMADYDGYGILEVEPSLANWRPRVMEWPQSVLIALSQKADKLRKQIYTLGGYQAVSRGEAPGARTPYRSILALQQADQSIHGPVNMRFRRSAEDFARKCWRQFKTYGDMPWLIQATGAEYAHLAESYIDKTKLSDQPPRYKLVSAFGASPEQRVQELLQLAQTRGADGQPVLTTEELRRLYPDQRIFDAVGDPRSVQRRRARVVAQAFEDLALEFRQQTGFDEMDMQHPWMQPAVQWVFQQAEARFKRFRDDDLMAHLAAYSEITQDETADPIARLAIMQRQELYFQWQAQIAQQNAMQPQEPEEPRPTRAQRPAVRERTVPAQSVPTNADVVQQMS